MGKSSGMPRGVEVNGKKLRVVFQWKGKRCRETLDLLVTPANIKAATRIRGQIINEIEAGCFDYGKHFPNKVESHSGTTFKQLAEVWLASRKCEVAKATFVKYEQCLAQFWYPSIGDRAITIPSTDLRKAIGDIAWDKLSPKRRNDALIPLRGVFQMALDDELIQTNPLIRVKNTRPRPRPADPFSLEEVESLLEAFPDEVRPIYTLLFFTGMRPGELIELKWSDIDLDLGLVHISRNRNLGETGDTKTHQPRDHELAGRVKAVLANLPRHSTGYLLHHPTTDKPFHEIRPLREVWWDFTLKELGLRHRNFYQTRHTYATLCIRAGANPYWIAKQMGTSPELVYSTYGKWIKQYSEVHKLDALIVP